VDEETTRFVAYTTAAAAARGKRVSATTASTGTVRRATDGVHLNTSPATAGEMQRITVISCHYTVRHTS